jgi:hypothetical protein
VALLRVLVKPTHVLAVPVMLTGAGITVTTLVAIQPVDRRYVMVLVPAATPLTVPVPDPTVAIPVVLLLQVPPPVALARVELAAWQTNVVPVIEAGNGLTVTTVVV